MLAALRLRIFGTFCKRHDLWFSSEFCPADIRERVIRQETEDHHATETLLPPSLRRPPVKRPRTS